MVIKLKSVVMQMGTTVKYCMISVLYVQISLVLGHTCLISGTEYRRTPHYSVLQRKHVQAKTELDFVYSSFGYGYVPAMLWYVLYMPEHLLASISAVYGQHRVSS